MEVGMVGLGRMGGNMVQRLLQGGHRIVAYDPNEEALQTSARHGATCVSSLDNLVTELSPPRAIWIMVPAGQATEDTIDRLANLLSPGDTIIDGANSNYKDTMRRSVTLVERRISFLDAGTSGGIWGLRDGYCMMIGGDLESFRKVEPIFQTLAPSSETGYGYVGRSGAGHFVKMIHNGVEYGLMQAYAEGFELMNAKQDFSLDMSQIAEIWRYGSVVRSWLLDLIATALHEDDRLEDVQAYVDDSGEGRWTVEESIELSIPIPVIAASLQTRFRSRQEQPFGPKMLAAMRHQFGGHPVRSVEGPSKS